MNTLLARGPWIIAGLILGLALVGIWNLDLDTALSDDNSATSSQTASTTPLDSGDVEVAAQPAGMTASIASVTVPPPGVWVAIQELAQDGSLGNVLGATRVHGPAANVEVDLLRSTYPGRTYAAVLYRDDGDGAFDLAHDSLYIDFDTGERVVARFTTTP